LCKQEGEESKIWLVSERPGPEHVKKARVLQIACGRQRVIRVVLEGWREPEREFPFSAWLLDETNVRVDGH
jgi:hypothetical protein